MLKILSFFFPKVNLQFLRHRPPAPGTPAPLMLLAALKKNYRRIPFHDGLKKTHLHAISFQQLKKKLPHPDLRQHDKKTAALKVRL